MITAKEYLSLSTSEILRFLENHLNRIDSESWWQRTVIDKLSEQQARLAVQMQYSTLRDFDLAALLNLLERNWRAVTSRTTGLDYRRGLNLIIELKNIRNHYAHESIDGTDLNQQLRDVDSITRLLKILDADSTIAEQGHALHRDLMARLLGVDNGKAVKRKRKTIAVKKLVKLKKRDELEPENLEQNTDDPQKGVPVHWLKAGTILDEHLLQRMRAATYVGIDFGTSTSVASIASVGADGKGLHTTVIEIKQIDELGREIHSCLVDTCLAWFNQQLLFGVGAARLKQELIANQTIWTSFKMGLGVDLGPEYNRTALPIGRHEYTIEKPQQAAAIFLRKLHDGIRDYVNLNQLPKQIYYTVTVPASFEANQRSDLFSALEFAGIAKNEIRLMDEPNAAFLSYLIDVESRSSGGRFVDALRVKKCNVIVFDFGAGTCDISILEVGVSRDSILSCNLGISKFWALGGDDIDKVIAERILLPQLCGADKIAKYLFTTTQLEQQVLPRLKSIAEALKISCCELAEHNGWKTVEDLKRNNRTIVGLPGLPFNIAGRNWELSDPQIKLSEFAEIIALFVGQPSKFKDAKKFVDVLQPINDALEKLDLGKKDVDMVLFIGGSCENPLIRHYVSTHLGSGVEAIIPRDLRAHVSQGAALYTLFLRGADIDPIKPITSETIYVLTTGGRLEPVVKAGSLVPSEGQLQQELKVIRNRQKTIDLPFYSGSVNKPIGMMQLKAPRESFGFKQGENVKIQWSISKEKILCVEAEVDGVKQTAEFQNPLANTEISGEILSMLKAKQTFNKSVLEGGGRPEANVTLTYANAAKKAGHWRLAAEMFEAVERLEPDADHATAICYCYSMDGDQKSSKKWSEIAYKRTPSAVTSYNHALDKLRNDNIPEYEQLMQECLSFNSNYTAALVSYGCHLIEIGDSEGAKLLQRAFDIFRKDMDSEILSSEDIPRFKRAANKLGKTDVLSALEKITILNDVKKVSRGFLEDNLVGGSNTLANKSD